MERVKIKPAPSSEVSIYLPYYPVARRPILPFALGLYKCGMLEGQRKIESGPGIAFVATWDIKTLPSDTTTSRIRFIDGDQFLDYELYLSNTEFIGYLMESINAGEPGLLDFPAQFYRKLLGYA